MAKETKNNTCAICKKYIDKSDATGTWTTILKARYYSLEQDKFIEGDRSTYCTLCASKIHLLIIDLKIEVLKNETKNI